MSNHLPLNIPELKRPWRTSFHKMSALFFWFRRDLRLTDNHGLFQALSSGKSVRPVFIFDPEILDKLNNKLDARVSFIYEQLKTMRESIAQHGGNLEVYYGKPASIWGKLLQDGSIDGVYSNEDYETYAINRDQEIASICSEKSKEFRQFKDQVIFAKNEVVKDDDTPYTVYTPYMRKWKKHLMEHPIRQFPSEEYLNHFCSNSLSPWVTLEEMGFSAPNIRFPEKSIMQGRISAYEEKRDIPNIVGTSRLSVHFRFGTISVREKFLIGVTLSEKWINELIWRDFYMQILYHFPYVVNGSFRKVYDQIPWRNNPEDFERWKSGTTGYPMVDAGMRELNQTGFMHNRVRMVVASFLTTHLLIDWRWGEAYFAEKLLDFELASNNGGWQWAAGSGVDAAPYFRVFNPESQQKKFDPKFEYIKQWIPEFGTNDYPEPIVEHSFARKRCLETYQSVLKP
jgi:deoxyribodipyrimidine photo-lyase